MQTFDTIGEAREGIMEFRAEHFGGVPEIARKQFKELAASPSPVDQIVRLGEFVWANRDILDAEAWSLGAGLISFATINAWHGLLENDRGNAIVANLRKMLGEITRAPAEPEAQAQYVVTPPAATPLDAEPAAE